MAETSNRRLHLVRTTKLLSVVALILLATPFVDSLFSPDHGRPDRRPISGLVVDLAGLTPGKIRRLAWEGKPVWIYHRTEANIAGLAQLSAELADPDSQESQQPPGMRNPLRSAKRTYFVFVPLETRRNCRVHLVPAGEVGAVEGLAWHGGFAEACYGAHFDVAGRIYAATGNPQQRNLTVPPYRFVGDTQLELLR